MSSVPTHEASIPVLYDACLGPLLFEPFALDLAARLHDKEYAALLEVACGTGRLTGHLVPRLRPGGRLVATDVDTEMLIVAKEKIKSKAVTFCKADALSLPFAGKSFEVVACQFGVMFFPDKALAFREAFRVLKKDGIFLFNTWDEPAANAVSLIRNEALQKHFPNDPHLAADVPFSFYRKEEIEGLLTAAGFSAVSIDTVSKTGYATTADDVVKGMMTGSPLGAYLRKKGAPVAAIENELKLIIQKRFSGQAVLLPMQALVCRAVKQ